MKIIASKIRSNPSKAWLGYIRPLIIEDEEGPRLADASEFRNNNEVFVTGSYDIVDSFELGQLFRITCKLNDQEPPDANQNSYYCTYVADGKDVEHVSATEYFHVIPAKFDAELRQVAMPFKPERQLFLLDGENLFGPFEYENVASERPSWYSVVLRAGSQVTSAQYSRELIAKFSAREFQFVETEREKAIVTKLSGLRQHEFMHVDFISNEQLLKLGNELLSDDYRLNKRELNDYKFKIMQLSTHEPTFDSARQKRLTALLDRLNFWTAGRSGLVSEFLATPAGDSYLQTYLESNKTRLFEDFERRFHAEVSPKKEQIEAEIRRLTEQKSVLLAENQRSKAELASKSMLDANERLKIVESEIVTKKKELDDLVASIRDITDLKSVKQEVEWNKRIRVEITNEVQELEATKKKIAKEINVSQSELKDKLRELKPYVDTLSGVIPELLLTQSKPEPPIKRRSDTPTSAALLVEEVRAALDGIGREYRFDQVANFLLTINQNFLSVFAGLPGIGKTSLVRYLAKSLGINDHRCFVTIPVARGMTSQRDLLGFYNSINQRFQAAPTGLYDALRSRASTDASSHDLPLWVLLDEANLSPVEHYFSSFLPMCDAHTEKIVRTGDPGETGLLLIPNSARFLATINNDSTTEPLSRRVLDRAPIILLEPQDIGTADLSDPIFPDKEVISQFDIDRVFPLQTSVEHTENEQNVVSKIYESLQSSQENSRGIPIVVSHRKRVKIQRYCASGRDLVQAADQASSSLRSLDFAIAQHVLPLIDGHGESCRNRLNDLRKAILPLDLSCKLLDQIIQLGESEYNHYRFFC